MVALKRITVGLRPEIARELKCVSIQREMQGILPFQQKDIVEQALERWLKEDA